MIKLLQHHLKIGPYDVRCSEIFIFLEGNLYHIVETGRMIRKVKKKDNFQHLLLLRSLYDQVLVRWLNSGLKIKYTSSEIQSEIFQIMSWQVFREIVQNIQSSVIYTIVADETADISNKEQLEFWITVG